MLWLITVSLTLTKGGRMLRQNHMENTCSRMSSREIPLDNKGIKGISYC